MRRLSALQDRLESGLRQRIPDLVIHGEAAQRVPSITTVSVRAADAEALLLSLDLEGIAASSGSACSSGAFEASSVLTAMGVTPELARASIRLSMGHRTTREEIDRVLAIFPAVVERVRSLAASAP
jgi:cysteine desulfurase